MKLWLESCGNWLIDEENLYFGISAHKHSPLARPKLGLKTWKGFTLAVYFYKWRIALHYVNDYAAYSKRINYRSTDKRNK